MDPHATGNPEGTQPNTNDGAPPPGGGGENSGADWRVDLSPEHQRVADKFNSPAEVVKSYAELEKKLGSAITLPGNDASDAEIEAYHKRMGRPASPEGYNVALPDGLHEALQPNKESDATTGRFLDAAFESGLASDQVQSLINWYYGELNEMVTAEARTAESANADRDATLRQEWGKDYESNLEFSNRAIAAFGDHQSIDRIREVAGEPAVLRMMARIGRQMGEAGDAAGGIGDHRRQTLGDELDALMNKDDYWQNESVQKRVREINVELYGTKPVVGASPGRNF